MSTASMPPRLPDGLVVFVKADCPTCVLVTPVLEQLARSGNLTVYTQDDPAFPSTASWVLDDTDLTMSFHHDVEVVPTLKRVAGGTVVAQTVGWSREDWETVTELRGLGPDLPDWRPGCGSLSVEPAYADELTARFGASGLQARRIELAELEDEMEAMYDRGWTDGLPVVPPTETRVLRMLEGTSREASEVVAIVPPDLVACTVEKVAINAVMAGCRPEYLPVILAAVEGVCTDTYNIHGVLATTMPVGPVLVVNGPIRHEIGMNSGMNVLGQGTRANSTIGRALQLLVRNVGGGRPGGVDRATHGSPAKIGFCFAEDEEGSFWEPLAVERGLDVGTDAVTVITGEAPHMVVDQLSRTPESLTRLMARSLLATGSPRMFAGLDATLVVGPEHMSRFADAGWSKADFRRFLQAEITVAADDHLRGVDGIAEGLPASVAGKRVPKFVPDGGLQIVHAGGGAGLFSAIIGGWARGAGGSEPVTRPISPWR